MTAAHRLFGVPPRSAVPLDIAIAVVALTVTLAQLAHAGTSGARVPHTGNLDATAVVLAACSTLPLLAWRRFPLGVLTATSAASVVLAGSGRPLDVALGPAVALFLFGAGRGTAWTWHTTGVVVGLLAAYLVAAGVAQESFPATVLTHNAPLWAMAWFAGERSRLRHEHIFEVTDRAHRAQRDAEREALLAAAEERARIARDLHDSAGHAISVIAVRAGAARLHRDPDRSLAALAAIEELARSTAAEIDQIVDALRQPGSPNEPVEAPPGLASLDTLVARHIAAGLEVTVAVAGAPRTPGDAADRAAYRILQEALTNAARHGTGSATVELTYGDTALNLTVTNPAPEPTQRHGRHGHGMIGMRERATLLGGDLHATTVDGTFQVHARIPYGGHQE
jgi:signal transduction histidine kinase